MRFLLIVLVLGIPAGMGVAYAQNWRRPATRAAWRRAPLPQKLGRALTAWVIGAIGVYAALVIAESLGVLRGLGL